MSMVEEYSGTKFEALVCLDRESTNVNLYFFLKKLKDPHATCIRGFASRS
jgi:hypothetical protein